MRLETFQYKKTWNYLYQNSKKTQRKPMDTAWIKNWQIKVP
jgi:hypothetical protein